MRSSTAVGFAAARGKFTSIPRYIIGAVNMKIRSSTRTTSTSGMMLISASVPPIRREPPPVSMLNAILGASWNLARGAGHLVQQIEREALHLRRPVLDAVDEEVVGDDRGNGRAEAGRSRDEGLRDAGSDDGQARRALLADSVERRDDPEHRAEEADERGGARRRGQERQIALQPRDLERSRPPQRPLPAPESRRRRPGGSV